VTQQPEQVTQQRVIAGRYVVLEEIGRGGMGVVWLAEDRTIGRRVAIKELHLPAGVPAEERRVLEERVLREARTAGRLNDPGVVTVYDVVQENGATYIVMELIQAPTLTAIVSRQGPLAPDQVARLADQLLSALEAAHAAGVVHRDVKPSNIMVLPNGRVKLTDFGIAQSTDDPRLTTSGILIGSPTYLAPEVIRGEQASAGSDLWALAASLFFAVEGYAAFERSSTAATMHAIVSEVPYLTRCHGPLASVIMGLLNSTPSARLSTQQVRGLLAQAAHPTGEQTVVHAPGTAMYPAPAATQRAAGPGRRKRNPWPVVAAVAVLVVGAFAGGWFGGRAGMVEPTVDPAKGSTYTYGGGDIPTWDLTERSCSSASLQAGNSYVDTTDCADAHAFEVLNTLDVFGSDDEAPYPSETWMRSIAESWCGLIFNTDGIVPADERDRLTRTALVPARDAWEASTSATSGTGRDRRLYCVIADRDGKQLPAQVYVAPN
jgi:hypothetical protein